MGTNMTVGDWLIVVSDRPLRLLAWIVSLAQVVTALPVLLAVSLLVIGLVLVALVALLLAVVPLLLAAVACLFVSVAWRRWFYPLVF